MKSSASPELVIEPLSMSYWSAFADLLDQGGPAGRCWCVAPMGIDYRRRPVASNRAVFQKAVKLPVGGGLMTNARPESQADPLPVIRTKNGQARAALDH